MAHAMFSCAENDVPKRVGSAGAPLCAERNWVAVACRKRHGWPHQALPASRRKICVDNLINTMFAPAGPGGQL